MLQVLRKESTWSDLHVKKVTCWNVGFIYEIFLKWIVWKRFCVLLQSYWCSLWKVKGTQRLGMCHWECNGGDGCGNYSRSRILRTCECIGYKDLRRRKRKKWWFHNLKKEWGRDRFWKKDKTSSCTHHEFKYSALGGGGWGASLSKNTISSCYYIMDSSASTKSKQRQSLLCIVPCKLNLVCIRTVSSLFTGVKSQSRQYHVK